MLDLNLSVTGGLGALDIPQHTLESQTQIPPRFPFSKLVVSIHTFLVLDSQIPNRVNTGNLVVLGLLSKMRSGNCWSQTHPSKGTPEEVPDLGGVN